MPHANLLINELATELARQPLEARLLAAPSDRIGRQWLDRVAAGGVMAANIRPTTIRRLLRDHAAAGLARAGLSQPSEYDRLAIIRDLLAAASGKVGAYFSGLRPSLALLRMLDAAFVDLGQAGLTDARILARTLSPPEKARETAELYAAFLARLAAAGFVAPGDFTRHALAALREKADALPLLLLPRDLLDHLSGAEASFWNAWPEARKRVLEVDREYGAAIAVFVADSPINEAREVFRRLAAGNIPLDRAEAVVVGRDGAAALAAAALEIFASPDGTAPRVEDLPLTFADGLPAGYSRPERLLAAWLDWLESERTAAGLAQLCSGGLLDKDALERRGTSAERLAAFFLALPAEPGAAAVVKAISRFGGADAGARNAARDFAAGVLKPLGGATDQTAILRATRALFGEWAESRGELDAYVKVRLLEDPFLSGRAEPWTDFNVREWLEQMLADLRIMGKGPQPGKLHISTLGGGHAGRTRLFVLGLDDSVFPGSDRQDPVLLDAERRRLSGTLRLAADRRGQREEDFDLLLARTRGNITLSYAQTNPANDQSLFPAEALLRAGRRSGSPLAGSDRDADQRTVALIPDAPAKRLLRRDFWLWRRLVQHRPPVAPERLASAFPLLASGNRALLERGSGRFTAWDGFVPEAGADFAAEQATLSATQLECLNACPMQYFFQYVLGVKPPDRCRPDKGVWLDHRDRGSLMHQLFKRFLAELMLRDERLDPARHRAELEAIASALVAEWKRRIPPREQSVFLRDLRRIRESCAIFLHREIAAQEDARPLYLEVSFGMENETSLPGCGAEPFRLPLPSGRTIPLSGKIDRVDRRHDGGLLVWDYKTGNADKYLCAEALAAHKLQAAIYAVVLDALPSISAPVAASGYYFPTPREGGKKIQHSLAELRPVLAILDTLAETLETGRFVFPVAADFTPYDYAPIYEAVGGVDKLTREAAGKTFSE